VGRRIVFTSGGGMFRFSMIPPRAQALLCLALIMTDLRAVAVPGDLDPSFGGTGIVTTSLGPNKSDGAEAVAIQSDGKIVAVGFTSPAINPRADFAMVRYNGDGSIDTTLAHTGSVTTALGTNNDIAYAVALQSDGKIVAAGYSFQTPSLQDFAIARYYSDGVLDLTFSGDGKLIVDFSTGGINAISNPQDVASAAAIQSDGKIVLAGYRIPQSGSATQDVDLLRCTPAGGIDLKVSTDLGANDGATSVVVQSDNKIVIAGYSTGTSGSFLAVVRYNANGTLDTTFNGTGKVLINFGTANAVALQSDGKIVTAGVFNNDFALARFNTDGSLDLSFNGTGKVTTALVNGHDVANSVVIQSDGKIIAAGTSSNGTDDDFALVRYNANGTLDNTFGSGGKVITAIGSGNDALRGIALQNDGKIVVSGSATVNGSAEFVVARYLGDAEIGVEHPPGTALVDGVSSLDVGNAAIGAPVSHVITIKNTGGADLNGIAVTFDGASAADFSLTNLPASTVAPNQSTTFTVRFAPTSAGTKTAALHINSNDSDENPFDIGLSGRGFVADADDDGDGLTNAAEINLAAFGFDPLVNNSALKSLLYDNRLGVGLYESGDMQALAMGSPLLSKDPNTGHFHLIISVEKSPNLMIWNTLTGFAATYDPNTGKIDMDITPDASNSQFFRVLGSKP